MRYSRFRATVTGHEPQKRSRHGDKNRVAKPSKKECSSRKDVMIKSESGVSLSSLAQLSPASLASPYNDDFSSRFLTPCSDDMASICPAAVEIRQARHASDAFSSMFDGNSDLFAHPDSLTHSPAFSAFEAAYDLSNKSGTSSDFQSPDLPVASDSPVLDRPYEWNEDFHDPQLF